MFELLFIDRLGWVGFETEESANQALKNMENGIMIKNTQLQFSK